MKYPAFGIALLLWAGMSAAAAPGAADGGGRDLSVAMFSTRELHAVTVSAAGLEAWTATCPTCPHRPLKTATHLSQASAHTRELFAGGPIRVTDDETHTSRTATGLWHLRVHSRESTVDVVLTIPSERYVAAVLYGESDPAEPSQSLRAMAVLVRTYALHSQHYHPRAGHLAATLCDSTQCQAMRLGKVPAAMEEAVRETAGETLWYGNRRAEVYFSQSCGGQTEEASAVWPTLAGVSYLKTHPDAYCLRKNKAMWHSEISLAEMQEIAAQEGWKLPPRMTAISISKRSPSGRALSLRFTGSDGNGAIVSASALRFGVGHALGWNRVRSDWYDVGIRNGQIVFDGRGFGHGVGLCQVGAYEMAAEGKSYREILDYYFHGAEVRIGPNDRGWQQASGPAMTIRSAEALPPNRILEMQRNWEEAGRRFYTKRSIHPLIVFAPTTELFRQMSGLPGWALAGTRGSTVVLQPAAVLRANGTDEAKLMLHEMLHLQVEAEATDRAELWLREGLTEVLAGEISRGLIPSDAHAIDLALRNAESLTTQQQAHRQAAALVKALVDRYSIGSVRNWLSTGVPVSAVASVASPQAAKSPSR